MSLMNKPRHLLRLFIKIN